MTDSTTHHHATAFPNFTMPTPTPRSALLHLALPTLYFANYLTLNALLMVKHFEIFPSPGALAVEVFPTNPAPGFQTAPAGPGGAVIVSPFPDYRGAPIAIPLGVLRKIVLFKKQAFVANKPDRFKTYHLPSSPSPWPPSALSPTSRLPPLALSGLAKAEPSPIEALARLHYP